MATLSAGCIEGTVRVSSFAVTVMVVVMVMTVAVGRRSLRYRIAREIGSNGT